MCLDSSPQHGRDYELMLLSLFRLADTRALFAASQSLHAQCKLDIVQRCASFAVDLDAMQKCREMLHVVCPSPAVLGRGRCT
eukprot:12351540-Alexandrium_andersonii.AAC.1